MTTFTLNSGNTYTQQDNGYCFAIIGGKKIRCSFASFKMAHDRFVKEENERQNAANEFVNIDPIEEREAQLDAAAENPEISAEQFCELIQRTEESIETEEIKEIQDMYCRHPEGTDLQVPAVLNQYGCVDCSKCNVQNCVHRDCMRRNPTSEGGLAECPRLKIKAEEPKAKKERKSKDIAYDGHDITLTAKQVDFIRHLSDTCFWEEGVDSVIWVDCLCDDIQGQFANKPMTVGAMISTLCEKGLGTRATERRDGRKCTSFALTELGKRVAAELGLH